MSRINHTITLGLALGSGSIGWCILTGDGQQRQLLAAGVRRFDAGVSDDIAGGRDESNAVERRNKRGLRRQVWRRAWRLRKVFHCLQKHGLLPPSDNDSADSRHKLFLKLDAEIRAALPPLQHAAQHLLPYRLRAIALDEPLKPFAFGRALYHIAQRRGFLSNRKACKGGDDAGAVKQGIGELMGEIERTGARTLGEYFAGLDPELERIRHRWTARSMLLDEFEAVWTAQSQYCRNLTADVRTELHTAIFHQRPLKSQSGLIGRCDLEPRRRRAPLACLAAQRIRSMQMVNDLTLTSPIGVTRQLTHDERSKLLAALNINAELTWTRVLSTIGLKNVRGSERKWEFNFKSGSAKKVIGNRTAAKMIEILGDGWNVLSLDQQTLLVDDLLRFESEEQLAMYLQRTWGFSRQTANRLSEVDFEPGYHSLSRRAIRKLTAQMEAGAPFITARKAVYGEHLPATREFDTLPALNKAIPSLRNPAAARVFSELRKIVNAIIRRYGKPDLVRIGLERDLKHSRDRRRSMADRIKTIENERARGARRLRKEGFEATPTNILKIRLADECGWVCPFTGRDIGMAELVGDHPLFEIVHILPLSLSLDSSFTNKTLRHHDESRHRKNSQTPWEAYGDTEQYTEILQRVNRFQGHWKTVAAKLERFRQQNTDPEEVVCRQLNDVRYMSQLAADYLGLLFGGRVDRNGRKRVETPTDGITEYLRKCWGLSAIMGSRDEKSRTDHRHRAIDALVVSLIDASAVRALAHAAELAERTHGGLPAPIEPPWSTLLEDVRATVEGIFVSSRVSRKLNGPLHKDTIFSKPKINTDRPGRPVYERSGQSTLVHHIRVPLARLSLKDVAENIVDLKIREVVTMKLQEIGGTPDTAFKDPANHPYLTAKDGRMIPIHKVRIRKSDNPMPVGTGSSRRYANAGSNHHLEIVAVLDGQGNEKKWEGCIVSRYDAAIRKRNGEPIIRRDHGEGKRFKFSITGSEHLMLTKGTSPEQLYRIENISEKQLEIVLHNDARPTAVRKQIGANARVRLSPSRLQDYQARKVTVCPLGRIIPAND